MKLVTRAVSVFFSALVVFGTAYGTAHACTPADTQVAQSVSSQLRTAISNKHYNEAETAYQRLVKMDASCVNATDHLNGGIAARKRGDIGTALVRFTTGGHSAQVASINGTYGTVRITGLSAAPSPRVLTWFGILAMDDESRAATNRAKDAVAGPGRIVAYLLPGHYTIETPAPHGTRVLFDFVVKAGETQMLNYTP